MTCKYGYCSNLTSVIIPEGVKTIEEASFYECSGLTSVTIPNSVTTIGGSAFEDCYALTSLTIPNGVTRIEGRTFMCCRSLTSITIPNSVTSIEEYAFDYCPALTSINIPNGVRTIGHLAFGGCSGLTSLTIPNSVTSIESGAFSGCSGLTSLTISNGVKTIGQYAFSGCSGLTSLTIPNSVITIDYDAFYECSGLTFLIIGSGVETINSGAFCSCNNLTEVYCLAEVPNINQDSFDHFNAYHINTLYVYGDVSFYSRDLGLGGVFGKILPLPEGITFTDDAVKALCMNSWDFNNNGELSIDEAICINDLGNVFKNNTDITSFDELKFFTGLTSIGDSVFYYCSNLASIIIPNNVNTIGNRAFYVCSGLKNLRLSANVTSIEDRAFAYCSGLESIVVDNGNTVYDSRDNCNALIETNTNTLLVGCKNTIIPSSVKVIAEGAFRGCAELTSIEIPEGVTTIGASAFRGCTGLESVTLPSTITSIGTYAFSAVDEVYSLTSVTVGMTTPVTITANVFPNRANSTLYVPKGSMAAYKAANYWKEFKNIVEMENGVPMKCEKPVITILANGKVKVVSATEGATCKTTITASNAEPLTDEEISLNTPLTVYTVTSYATKEGYDDSEVATATFRYEKTEGDVNIDGVVNINDVIQLVNMILGQ